MALRIARAQYFVTVPLLVFVTQMLAPSKATAGRSHRESGVDVGVLLDRTVFPSARARFQRGVELSSRLQASLGTRLVDLVVLNDAPPGLGRRVVTSGRRQLDRDQGATHAFVRDVQLRAADLDPFLRWTREIKLAALAR